MAKNTRKISKRRSDRRKPRTTKKHKGGSFFSNFMGKSKTVDDVTQEINTKTDRLNKVETRKKDLTAQITYYKKTKDYEKELKYKSGYEKKIKKLESELQQATAEVTKLKSELKKLNSELMSPNEIHHQKFFLGKKLNETQFSISEYKLDRTKQLKDLLQEIESDANNKGPGVYTLSYFFKIEEGKDGTK
jgi:chromosome segregation ATPase